LKSVDKLVKCNRFDNIIKKISNAWITIFTNLKYKILFYYFWILVAFFMLFFINAENLCFSYLLRGLIGIIYLFYTPGHIIANLMNKYFKDQVFSKREEFMVKIVISVLVVILSGLILNFLWEITRDSIVIFITAFLIFLIMGDLIIELFQNRKRNQERTIEK